MKMKLKSTLAASLLVLALSACGKSDPQPATEPAPTSAPAPTKHEGMDHGQMQSGCDMQGMDMSKMSAAEHQAMMEECQKAGTAGDGHAEHGEHP